MSQVPVKWVPKGMVFEQCPDANPVDMLPVVPLSALREVVEGLKNIVSLSKEPLLPMAESCALMRDEAQRLLASLGGSQ